MRRSLRGRCDHASTCQRELTLRHDDIECPLALALAFVTSCTDLLRGGSPRRGSSAQRIDLSHRRTLGRGKFAQQVRRRREFHDLADSGVVDRKAGTRRPRRKRPVAASGGGWDGGRRGHGREELDAFSLQKQYIISFCPHRGSGAIADAAAHRAEIET